LLGLLLKYTQKRDIHEKTNIIQSIFNIVMPVLAQTHNISAGMACPILKNGKTISLMNMMLFLKLITLNL
jgi:hypothetical protein